jgi:hypothetical protein
VFASSLRILLVLAIAAGAGYIRARALPWVPDVEAITELNEKHAWIRANTGVTLEQFQDLIDQGAVVIDARSAEDFEQGHLETGGYPPVLNVPPEEIHQQIDRLMQLQGYPLVIYCTSSTCEFGDDLYIELERYGFFDIRIYFPGWEAITELGLPTATGPDTWTGFDDEFDAGGAYETDGAEAPADPNQPEGGQP